MPDLRPDAGDLPRLMAAYQAGDPASFDAIYARLAPPLRRYLVSLTRDAALAEDLLQETFLRLHRVRHTYDPARPTEPWAYAIARHVMLMERRCRSRRGVEAPLETITVTDGPPRDAAGARADTLAERTAAQPTSDARAVTTYDISRALDGLPADRRRAVVLHHVWGFRFDEIAARLGIREGTARLRAHRGLKALRERFLRGRR